MRIAVTGVNGLLGGRAAALLSRGGHAVTGIGRGPRRASGAFAYASCDLSSDPEAARALDAARPEAILHCAALTDVDACERDPDAAFAANVDAAANVAKAARRAGAHLVHLSTDYVFDGQSGPYDEAARPDPRGVYALTKHLGEQAARELAPGAAIARTAVVYGWPAAGRPNFGAWLVGALASGERVRLFQDQRVSPSLAWNVAEMVCEILVRGLGGIWNASGAEVVDRVAFGRALCARFGFDESLIVPVRLEDAKLLGPRPLQSGLLVDKARAQLRAQPLSLAEALDRFHREWAGDAP